MFRNRQPFEPPANRPIPITQPPDRGPSGRQRRSVSPLNPDKINNLQKEFQGLKEKIKEVEKKNTDMLGRIKKRIAASKQQEEEQDADELS